MSRKKGKTYTVEQKTKIVLEILKRGDDNKSIITPPSN